MGSPSREDTDNELASALALEYADETPESTESKDPGKEEEQVAPDPSEPGLEEEREEGEKAEGENEAGETNEESEAEEEPESKDGDGDAEGDKDLEEVLDAQIKPRKGAESRKVYAEDYLPETIEDAVEYGFGVAHSQDLKAIRQRIKEGENGLEKIKRATGE